MGSRGWWRSSVGAGRRSRRSTKRRNCRWQRLHRVVQFHPVNEFHL